MSDHLLTTKEAADYLRLSPGALTNARSKKKIVLPVVKIGTAVRFRKEDLEAWVASKVVNG